MKYTEEIYKHFRDLWNFTRVKVDSLTEDQFKEYIAFLEGALSIKILNTENDKGTTDSKNADVTVQDKVVEFVDDANPEDSSKSEVVIPFTIESVRVPPSDKEIVKMRKIRKEEKLLKFRQALFEGYEIEDDFNEKYEEKIKKLYSDIGAEPPTGYLVSVVLVDGTRITRRFPNETIFKDVYIWISAYEKVIKEKIRFGDFIIMDIEGQEIVPSQVISTLQGNRQLFFMRNIYK